MDLGTSKGQDKESQKKTATSMTLVSRVLQCSNRWKRPRNGMGIARNVSARGGKAYERQNRQEVNTDGALE